MKTRKSFYRALKKTVNMFDWKLDAGHIRGFIKNEPSLNYRPFCPLTAVHFCRTGSRLGLDEFEDAAKVLKAEFNPLDIVVAADNNEDANSRIRSALLRATGLYRRKVCPACRSIVVGGSRKICNHCNHKFVFSTSFKRVAQTVTAKEAEKKNTLFDIHCEIADLQIKLATAYLKLANFHKES